MYYHSVCESDFGQIAVNRNRSFNSAASLTCVQGCTSLNDSGPWTWSASDCFKILVKVAHIEALVRNVEPLGPPSLHLDSWSSMRIHYVSTVLDAENGRLWARWAYWQQHQAETDIDPNMSQSSSGILAARENPKSCYLQATTQIKPAMLDLDDASSVQTPEHLFPVLLGLLQTKTIYIVQHRTLSQALYYVFHRP
jgi:hypothetical protein